MIILVTRLSSELIFENIYLRRGISGVDNADIYVYIYIYIYITKTRNLDCMVECALYTLK